LGVGVVIAVGLWRRSLGLLSEKGIQVSVGAPSSRPEALVEQYLQGTLITGQNICDH
jgi:predicted Fe-Mo cluster-binding NifX family protein